MEYGIYAEMSLKWLEGFYCLMRLWQAILVIPANIKVCKREFSKLKIVKNDDRSKLSLETLDMLMFLYFSAHHALNGVNCNVIYDVWKQMKTRKPLPLLNIYTLFILLISKKI